MSAIRLENVSKVYGGGGDAAVKDVNLTIDDGELMILVGPSGCGKSTLLRMIVGLEEVTEGDVFVGDDRVTGKAPRDRNLAMVFQNYALYPHLTVYENIAFPLRLRKVPGAQVDAKVREAAEMLELTDFLARRPAQLSGGQRQRVAMGRALVRDAAAFLFDEPLSNLDAKLRGQMRTEIGRLQQRLGVTTVYVTHDQIEAMTLGDRVAVLRKGEVQQVDSPRDLYEHPVNLFVAGFIGSPSMNLMPARVEGEKLHLPVAELQLSPELASRLAGKESLIAGIRPEAFEVASSVARHMKPFGAEFTAKVDVVEWLGSEQYAYVPFDAPVFDAPVDVHQPLAALAEEMDTEQTRTQIVVNLDANSPLKPGGEAKLWLDPRRMHLFDPESGENLTNGSGVTVALPE